ncbi:MAG: sigma-70 family RNA polymerase sigma factor [Acidobacteria bacterium]|nr:sigma-70 family RNA polymerase sigma factor [Acidobacteriota bacterium]
MDEEELLRDLEKKIFYFALKHLSDRETALEITNETLIAFLEVYRSGGARNPDNPGGLAYGIFRNKLANHFRKAKREEQAFRRLAEGEPAERSIPDPLSERRRQEEIREALLRLNFEDREILVMYFREERSCREISELLGMDAHQVSVRKWRALRKMKKWLR